MGKTQLEYPQGLGFEQVWTGLQETRKLLDEIARRQEEADRRREEADRHRQEEADRRQEEAARRQEEIDRQMKETARRQEETAQQMKETDKQIKETARRQEETAQQMKETDRQIKEYNRRFGEFTKRFGEIVEYMVAPNLREKFRELKLNFPKAVPNLDVSDTENDIFLEVDVMLENGDKAMLVETKTKPTTEDVKDHVKRLQKMRRYADLHGDKRKFLGAVAGVVMTGHVERYILDQGFFAVQPSGETFNIISPQGQPREW